MKRRRISRLLTLLLSKSERFTRKSLSRICTKSCPRNMVKWHDAKFRSTKWENTKALLSSLSEEQKTAPNVLRMGMFNLNLLSYPVIEQWWVIKKLWKWGKELIATATESQEASGVNKIRGTGLTKGKRKEILRTLLYREDVIEWSSYENVGYCKEHAC